MAASKLSIYNAALRALSERRLSSESEDISIRYLLDDIWDDGLVRNCLEQGLWNFALRTVKVDYDPSFTASFGLRYQFGKPDDMARVSQICIDEYFKRPVLEIQQEGAYWYADYETLYIQYVSFGELYGADFAKWPEVFEEYVQLSMAEEACIALNKSNALLERIMRRRKEALKRAKSNDAMEDSTKFPPLGSWTLARYGGWGQHAQNRSGSAD